MVSLYGLEGLMLRVQGLGCRFSGFGAKRGVNTMDTMTLQLLGYTPIFIYIYM